MIKSIIGGVVLTFILVLGVVFFPMGKGYSTSIDECYNKQEQESPLPPEFSYKEQSNRLSFTYTFHQKCYENIDASFTNESTLITMFLNIDGLQDNCFCSTTVKGKMNPVASGEYNFSVQKIIGDTSYQSSREKLIVQ